MRDTSGNLYHQRGPAGTPSVTPDAVQSPAAKELLALAEMYKCGGVTDELFVDAVADPSELWRPDAPPKAWWRVRTTGQGLATRLDVSAPAAVGTFCALVVLVLTASRSGGSLEDAATQALVNHDRSLQDVQCQLQAPQEWSCVAFPTGRDGGRYPAHRYAVDLNSSPADVQDRGVDRDAALAGVCPDPAVPACGN